MGLFFWKFMIAHIKFLLFILKKVSGHYLFDFYKTSFHTLNHVDPVVMKNTGWRVNDIIKER